MNKCTETNILVVYKPLLFCFVLSVKNLTSILSLLFTFKRAVVALSQLCHLFAQCIFRTGFIFYCHPYSLGQIAKWCHWEVKKGLGYGSPTLTQAASNGLLSLFNFIFPFLSLRLYAVTCADVSF